MADAKAKFDIFVKTGNLDALVQFDELVKDPKENKLFLEIFTKASKVHSENRLSLRKSR